MKNETLKLQLEKVGVLLLNATEVPLKEIQWQQLETIVRQVDYEHIIGGDAGEGHSVYVSRFVNDVVEPTNLQPRADEVKELIMSDVMLSFYQSFIGNRKLCLRRCQANLLKQRDYIGRHVDQHSNPDYIASIVFHFKSDYMGGDFVSQTDTDGEIKLHPEPHSIVVNRGDIWHEIKPVVSGERRTLACFLSSQFGKSRHGRKAFEVSR